MNFEITYLVTLSLMLIALGIGLGLTTRDFGMIARNPRGVFAGLAGQLILLPVIATAMAFFAPTPVLAAGLILVGVCPGGSSSNYFTYLARGDVALSVSLTAITASLAVFFVPIVFNLSSQIALGEGIEVSLPVAKTMRDIAFILLMPVAAGMLVRRANTAFAEKWKGRISTAAFLLLVALTPVLISRFFGALVPILVPSIALVTALLICMIAGGLLIARLVGVSAPQTRSLTIEIGVQNIALAIYLSLTYLGSAEFVIIPIAYLIMMYVFIPAYVWLVRRQAPGNTND